LRPAFERIAHPTTTVDGRRAGPRFGDPRVQALGGALSVILLAVTGITNQSLRALMTGLLGQPYSMSRASYDLTRLRRNDLIERIPDRNTYRLTCAKTYPPWSRGLSPPYSNGPIEGAISKAKLLKRQMYGRAGFPLLRKADPAQLTGPHHHFWARAES
jgi:hypothetical protein